MWLYLFITSVVLLITYYLKKHRGLPVGPWGIPIVGYLPWLDSKAPYLTLTELSKKYGSIYGLTLGNVYAVVLTDPKMIKTLFSKDVTTGRAPLYLTHGIMEGYGLICAQGDLWKEQRRFVYNCLRQFGASKIGQQRNKMEMLIMNEVVDLVNYLGSSGESICIDPLKPLEHSVGSVMNMIIFGKSWSRDDELWKWILHAQDEGTKYIGVAGPLNFLPFIRFLPKYRRTIDFLMAGKYKTHALYQTLIQEQSELLKQQNSKSENPSNIILEFLKERALKNGEIAEKFYNDQQFYHLLGDLFGAGLDTTLTTLRWYLLFLAKYPTIQETVRNEIQDVLQGRFPSIEDKPHLPLVEASICETQRIRSVVPVGIPHGTWEDMEVEGFRIPKGTMILPLQWAIHMNEKIWTEPQTFNPSRFIDDEGKIVKSEYLIPFQTGKRMCVGDELAKILLFLFGATIVQNFSLELENAEEVDMTGECGITLTPRPYKIIFNKI